MTLEVTLTKLQKGPYAKLKFCLSAKFGHYPSAAHNPTLEVDIADCVKLRFQFRATGTPKGFGPPGDDPPIITTSMSMMTPLSSRDHKVTLYLAGKNFSKQWECPQSFTSFTEIQSNPLKDQEIELNVEAHKIEVLKFENLYNDRSTDFSLVSEEGQVEVHKEVLAAHSDFFKTMFGGNWRETQDNTVELRDSLSTLKHLKDYLYLGTLPDSELEPLLLIAKFYLMESLQQQCLVKMSQGATSKTREELVEFACDYNVPELIKVLNKELSYDADPNTQTVYIQMPILALMVTSSNPLDPFSAVSFY